MATWLDKLWVADEPKEKKEPVVVQKAQEAAPVSTAVSYVGTGGASDELMDTIIAQVKAKAGDNAYYKLRAGMDAAIANKLDECSAAKAASAMIPVQPATVTPAIDEVVALVEGERTLFATTTYKQAIEAADALSAHAADLQGQINALLEQVKQLSEENINTQQEASKAHSEAEVMAATFDASAAKYINILTAEKQKLTTYLS